jgi:eukaryotic-like serine/threonine-protein kinase
MLAWFLFVPVLYAIGIRNWWDVLYIALPAAGASATAFYAASRRHIGYNLQIAVMIFMLLGAIAISRVFGSLIMMPTLVATYAIVLQAHPSHWFRQLSLLVGALAQTVPTVLELIGVIPRSYLFEGGRWIVLPQMIALPQGGTIGLLFAANLAMMVIPCMFIAKMRADLSNVQARQLVQAWHFRRIGDELMRTAA